MILRCSTIKANYTQTCVTFICLLLAYFKLLLVFFIVQYICSFVHKLLHTKQITLSKLQEFEYMATASAFPFLSTLWGKTAVTRTNSLTCVVWSLFFLFHFETWQTTLLYGEFEMQLSLLAAFLHLPRTRSLLPTYSQIIFFTQQKEAFIAKPSNSWAVCGNRRKSVVGACNGKPGCVFSVFFLWPLGGRAIRAKMYREKISQYSNQSKHYMDFDCSNKNEGFVNWSSFIDLNEEMYLFCFVKCSKLCLYFMLMNSEMKE